MRPSLGAARRGFAAHMNLHGNAPTQIFPPPPIDPQQQGVSLPDTTDGRGILLATLPPGKGDEQEAVARHPMEGRAQDAGGKGGEEGADPPEGVTAPGHRVCGIHRSPDFRSGAGLYRSLCRAYGIDSPSNYFRYTDCTIELLEGSSPLCLAPIAWANVSH